MNTSKRILIVGIDWLGDVIFSTPVIRAMRKKYPNAFIAYSTASRCLDVLKNNPYLDELIAYDEKPFLLNIAGNARFVQRLRQLKFDEAWFLHRSSTRAFLTRVAGIPNRIGYAHTKRDWLLTQRQVMPRDVSHRIDIYLGLLRGSGIACDGREVDFFINDDDRTLWEKQKSRTPLADGRPYVVFHPGGNWDLKRWPIDSYRRLASFFKVKGIRVVVCGTAKEAALAGVLADSASPKDVVSLCGETSIRTLACLIEESLLIISNDSGPIHLAAALGTPLVGLFGPTSPEDTGPVSRGRAVLLQKRLGCEIPCYFEKCHHRVCLDRLSPEEVMEAAEGILTKAVSVK